MARWCQIENSQPSKPQPDVERLRWAFGLAEYHAPLSPIERCLGTPAMTKDGIAWGAFAGACAASLAEKGFTGNPKLTWRTEENGAAITYDTEPRVDAVRRFKVDALKFLPIESQL